MPEKVLSTPYPVIDIDPHFTRVVRYFRASDYATWGATTVGVPGALLVWGEKLPAGRIALGNAIQIVTRRMVTGMRVAAFLGACGGFLLAYQNSSMRFLGFTENAREAQMDLIELSQRAREGKPLYGESHQSPWVQGAAHRNSVFSMLKFCSTSSTTPITASTRRNTESESARRRMPRRGRNRLRNRLRMGEEEEEEEEEWVVNGGMEEWRRKNSRRYRYRKNGSMVDWEEERKEWRKNGRTMERWSKLWYTVVV